VQPHRRAKRNTSKGVKTKLTRQMFILPGIAFIAGGVMFYLSGSPRFRYLFKDKFPPHMMFYNMSPRIRAYYRIMSKIGAIAFILIGLKFIFNDF
jgi:hypothetical protein